MTALLHSATADLIVVSPHLDDAVMSLGTFIARTSRAGRRVVVVTVFAGDPDSPRPSGGWDRRARFASEGEAATARRHEDREACRLVGADPSWLTYSEADYRDGLDAEAIAAAVTGAVMSWNPKAVLLPGFPLTNADHSWLRRVIMDRCPLSGRVGLYAEQPYRYRVRRERGEPVAPNLSAGATAGCEWTYIGGGPRELWLKRRAILAYRSQLPLLGFSQRRYRRLNQMLIHERLHGGEAMIWLSST